MTPEAKKVQDPTIRCDKGTKLPGAIKDMMAMSGRSKADRRYIMRMFAVAIHDMAAKAKSAQRDVKSSTGAAL